MAITREQPTWEEEQEFYLTNKTIEELQEYFSNYLPPLEGGLNETY